VLAFLALDDITTDNATSFAYERVALIACAGWFTVVSWQLVPISQDMGPAGWPVHGTALLGLAWFTALAGVLAWLGWRARSVT
jgi:hypothetical protein